MGVPVLCVCSHEIQVFTVHYVQYIGPKTVAADLAISDAHYDTGDLASEYSCDNRDCKHFGHPCYVNKFPKNCILHPKCSNSDNSIKFLIRVR